MVVMSKQKLLVKITKCMLVLTSISGSNHLFTGKIVNEKTILSMTVSGELDKVHADADSRQKIKDCIFIKYIL
jgi:hypothetical protein